MDRLDDIVSVVGGYFGVANADLRSSRRTGRLHHPRCIAVYLADRISGSTRAEIAAAFGRDPTIIALYCRAIERELSGNSEYRRLVEKLELTLKLSWRTT
jgi:chromosomal replication initiation ATPase DnaA